MANLLKGKQIAQQTIIISGSTGNVRVDGPLDTNGNQVIVNVAPNSQYALANKAYVDAVAQGVSPHAPVRFVSTSPITLSGNVVIDGGTTAEGDRILVTGQADAKYNGLYNSHSGATAWTRTVDADGDPDNEILLGDFVFVESGTTNANSGWVLGETNSPDMPITPDVDTQVWFKMAAPGSFTSDGNAIKISGNSFYLDIEDNSLTQSVTGLKVSTGYTASISTAISTGDASVTTALSTTISTAISSEVSSRTSADSSLSTALSTGDSSLSTAISNEVSTRTSADTSLSNAISTNVSTLTSTDVVLSTAISTEVSTRTSADTSLANALSTGDSSLSTAISSEVSSRTSADTSLANALSTGDSSLSAAISTNLSTLTSVDISLSAAISAVTNSDSSLSTAISTEVSTRTSADTSLANALSTGDSSLSTAISSEVSSRTSADTSLANALSTGDSSLSAAISTNLSTLTSTDVVLSTAISTEVSSRTSADTSLANAISASVVNVYSESFSAPASGATSAVVVSSSAFAYATGTIDLDSITVYLNGIQYTFGATQGSTAFYATGMAAGTPRTLYFDGTASGAGFAIETDDKVIVKYVVLG